MAKLLKLRRGTTTQHASFTGAEGELTVDTTKDTAVVHDGSTQAGRPLAREDMNNVSSASIAGRLGTDSIATTKIAAGALPTDVTVASANIVDGTIVNADISGSAAIDASKISGLTLDKIYEGDSKVEVVDAGTGYVSTVVDGTEASRVLPSGNTIFTSAIFGSNTSKTDGSGQGISLLYGGGTSNVGVISCTHTSGLIIKNNAAISFQQNGFPNNYYASFNNNGGSFSTGGTARFDYDGTNINFALNVLPDTDSNYDIGTSAKRFANAYVDAIDLTGNVTTAGDIVINSAGPKISLNDTGQNPDYDILNTDGVFQVNDVTNGAIRWRINTDGHVDVTGNLDVGAGLDVTGVINSTIDSADNTLKIETTTSGDAKLSLNAAGAGGHDIEYIRSSNTLNFKQGGGSVRMSIDANGTVDVAGNLDVGAGIDVTGDILGSTKIGKDAGDYITFTTDTQMDVYVNGNNEFRFEADGDFHADGDVIAQSTTTASDRRLKENIEVIPNALDKVQALNGVSFNWKKTGEKSAGVIAQEVQEVLPEAVKEVTPVGGGDSHLTVNYHALTSILIESIKELKAEIEELKGGK